MSQAPWTLFWPRSGFTPTPLPSEIAGGHGEIGDRHDRRGALAVLGDAETVVDRAVAAGGIEARGAADRLGRHAGDRARPSSRAVLRLGDEGAQRSKASRSQRSRTKASSTRPSVTITCAPARSASRRWCRAAAPGDSLRLDVRRCARYRCGADRSRSAWRPAQPLLHARGEDRMGVGRIGADDQDDVGLLDRIEVLRAGRGAEGLAFRP